MSNVIKNLFVVALLLGSVAVAYGTPQGTEIYYLDYPSPLLKEPYPKAPEHIQEMIEDGRLIAQNKEGYIEFIKVK